jgi:hypothetical protein
MLELTVRTALSHELPALHLDHSDRVADLHRPMVSATP